jgi:MFS family permease
MASVSIEPAVPDIAESAHAAAGTPAQAWPHPARAWLTLLVLTFALVFSFLDRQILVLMIEPIKKDFGGLSDTKVSLLLGPAFVLLYAFSSLPISRIADWANRKIIIALGVAFWSLMTICCGLAQNYALLFIARMGVGAGESSFSPATYSILTDVFPREKLATAAGVLSMGVTYGSATALIVGGAVIGLVSNMPDTVIPGLGVIHPWQWAFVAVGTPGFLVALLIYFAVQEPARRGKVKIQDGRGKEVKSVPVGQVIKFLLDDWKCFGPIFATMFVRSLAVGVAAWVPSFFVRSYGWDIPKVGLTQGLVLLFATPLGIWIGGKLSQRWTGKGMWDCNLRIALIMSAITMPSAILYPLSPSPWLALGLMAFNTFLLAIATGPSVAAVQLIVPNQMRGQVNSLNLLIYNLSVAFAPTFVALCTNFVFHKDADLRYSIVLISVIIYPLVILLTWIGLKPYARSAKRAHEQFT